MIPTAVRSPPHSLLASLCLGTAAANLVRIPLATSLGAAAFVAAIGATCTRRRAAAACALALIGWGWGSARLDRLDHSTLRREIGRAERARVVVTAPARRGRFELKLPVRVLRFGRVRMSEPAQLELPLGRAPPQGALLEVRAEAKLPRGSLHGFDERMWLRRHGIHVVLAGDEWRVVGRRGGFGGVADRLRAWLRGAVGAGQRGEERAVLLGVVLGDDGAIDRSLRDRFRASGLYHLLAVSGQNILLLAGGALLLAWLLGIPRWLGEVAALVAIGAYVLAVGPQPSVIRAGISGALASLAWLAARPTDRWYFLLLGALALLAWNPYTLLDAGFQLSFGAVTAIFVLVPRLRAVLTGYLVPGPLADVLAVSTACAVATAPILWFQFHAVSLVAVPANAAAAPAMPPLLGLALAGAAVHPLAPSLAALIARLDGLCAAYLTACARLFGSLPVAQIRSGWAAAALAVGAGGAWAYARRAWPRSSPRTSLPAATGRR